MDFDQAELKVMRPVWYFRADEEGYYLIVRQIEDDQYRLELQKKPHPQYVPFCTATVFRRQITDVVTPTWNRKKGHARRLLKNAKTTAFPDLILSGPATWRGRHLYDALTGEFPDMRDENYESDPKKREELELEEELELDSEILFPEE